MPLQNLTVNGARFTYQEAGAADAPVIIVLHGGRGIGDHRGDFQAFLPLADHYRVIAYDQRGCGESSLTPPFTFDQFADDLEAIRLKLVGDRQITVLGGSFGGMIALTYAVKYPGGLDHLILRGTAASHHHEAQALENFRQRLHKAPSASIEMVEKILSDTIIDDVELRLIWLALAPLYREQFDPNLALERTRTMHLHAETHNALFRHKTYDVRAQLKDIAVPTLVITGEHDWICPPQGSREVADGIRGAQLWVVEGCNHSVHLERTELVIARIRQFLE